MNVLLIGGGIFLGPALIESFLEKGATVTILNRGIAQSKYPLGVRHICADRKTLGVEYQIEDSFDVVVDTCGYTPDVVRTSAEYLKEKCSRYIFISTQSVYADSSTANSNEDYPVAMLPAGASLTEVTGETYGALKALCEEVVSEVYGKSATLLRPGLIIGKGDRTHRCTYWLETALRGGEFIAPGNAQQPIQYISVDDLARFAVCCAVEYHGGAYTVVTPNGTSTWGSLIDTCIHVAKTNATPVWVSDQFLLENNVQPWVDMPMWIPDVPEYKGFYTTNVDKALQAGLTIEPLEQTLTKLHDWLCATYGTALAESSRSGASAFARNSELREQWKIKNNT